MRRTRVGLRNPDSGHSEGVKRFIFTRLLICQNVSRTALVGMALTIFAGALWLYWPSTRGGFLKVDDTEYLRQSIRWGGLTWNAVKWAFTSTDAYYQPLVRLSHVLDYQIWGMNAAGHHVTSVFLHALDAALVFGFLWTLLGATSLTTSERLSMAVWGAVVFAIHPLQTESVAWMAVRTQLLCTTFGISCLWAYTAGVRRRVVWGLYVTALLCKPTVVSLPFVMLAIDYFPLRRHERLGWGQLVLEKAVMIGIAGMVGAATVITESRWSGPMTPLAAISLSARASRAFESLAFYPLKLGWPSHLSPNYVSDVPLGSWTVSASVLVVVILSAMAVMERRRLPTLVVAWGAYLALALPMSPLMPNGRQVVALRYAYEATVPLLLLVGAAGVWLWRRSTPTVRGLLVGLLACELCAFAISTRRLIPDWRDDETMHRATLAEFPGSEEANRSLATELSDQERAGEALPYAQRGVDIAPQVCEAHVILGHVLGQLGRFPEAIRQEEQALQINPYSASANFSSGWILVRLGKVREAVEHYEQALRITPDDAVAHNNLANALLREGKVSEAIRHYEQALRTIPDSATAHYNLGLALARTARTKDAIAQFELALQISPDYAEAHYDLGNAFLLEGKASEAIGHYQQALHTKPDDAEAHGNLGLALARTGKIKEAIAHFELALRINPDYAEAHDNLGLALEKLGRTTEAIEHYEQALKLRPGFAPTRDALARLQGSQ
ncbi:MAG: tetratricopeptide repeat protein [Verrucomicrobiia bacterium]